MLKTYSRLLLFLTLSMTAIYFPRQLIVCAEFCHERQHPLSSVPNDEMDLLRLEHQFILDELKCASEKIGIKMEHPVYGITPKLCLTMIVKNESHIIERCLNSVKGLVDCISICDTGSDDHTPEIIERFMHDNKIPGIVHRHQWRNFGYNRTLCAIAAKKTLLELGFSLENFYLLLLDADMILNIREDFNASTLADDSYLVVQKCASMSYENIRLFRASLPWECAGTTHEGWKCRWQQKTSRLKTLWIEDREDGGSKAEKNERDIALLTESLKEDPENERYMFYIAQTYHGMKDYSNAIKWFLARLEKGGWKEEIWYSKLRIGQCYEELGFWDQALNWYLKAYTYHPSRAEPLHFIAQYYRLKGQNQLAYLFAKQGSKIPYPEDDLLFISHPVYDYQFDEEISIAGYYTPFKEDGFASVNRLLLNRASPPDVKDQAYRNLIHYTENLKNAQFFPMVIDLPFIREGMEERYDPMNASILKTGDGYLLICRTVNYDRKQNFKSRDPLDSSIKTRNYLVDYDTHFNIRSQKEILEDFPRPHGQSHIKGLEDCRIISYQDGIWFTCATFGTHKAIGQTLCKLSNSSSSQSIKVEKFIPLKSPNPHRHEKNWIPFEKDGNLFVIYLYDPLTIYKIDTRNGNLETIETQEAAGDFSSFRGSCGPIPYLDGYLMLIHEVFYDTVDYYMHRFVFLDKSMHIVKLSKPFIFKHKGVEYCTGMVIDHKGKNCVMPISIEDREAWICSVPLEMIQTLLEPLPTWPPT